MLVGPALGELLRTHGVMKTFAGIRAKSMPVSVEPRAPLRSAEPQGQKLRQHNQFSIPRSDASQSRLPSSLVSRTAAERPWLRQTFITGVRVGAE
jgi:hypothetical protein